MLEGIVTSNYAYALPDWYYTLLPIIIVWSLVWKGWALWIAARKGSKIWYVVLLIVNTIGILEILYIFVFSKRGSGMLPAKIEPMPVAPPISTPSTPPTLGENA